MYMYFSLRTTTGPAVARVSAILLGEQMLIGNEEVFLSCVCYSSRPGATRGSSHEVAQRRRALKQTDPEKHGR